jgi:hypothetical protein
LDGDGRDADGPFDDDDALSDDALGYDDHGVDVPFYDDALDDDGDESDVPCLQTHDVSLPMTEDARALVRVSFLKTHPFLLLIHDASLVLPILLVVLPFALARVIRLLCEFVYCAVGLYRTVYYRSFLRLRNPIHRYS